MSNRRAKASAAAAAAAMQRAGLGGGFVGFDAFAAAPAAAPADAPAAPGGHGGPPGPDAFLSPFYEGADEQVRSHFKSLGKRDAQTKVKALQALADMAESDATSRDALRQALRHFIFHFQRICMREKDHKVRERANACLAVFAARVPKLLAKSLSAFAPDMLCSLADPVSAEVRRAAQAALAATRMACGVADRPEDLLAPCADAVGAVLGQRIRHGGLGGGPGGKGKQDEADPELAERVLASTVGSLAIVAASFSAATLEAVLGQALGQDAAKVWRPLFTAKTAPQVRAAAGEALAAICRAGPRALPLDAATAGLLLKAVANEDDAAALRRAIDALLAAIVALQPLGPDGDLFALVGDFRKTFFPSLWRLLRDAGRGAAAAIYPAMLPMLSLVPQRVWDDYGAKVLADKWLEEQWAGLGNQDALGPHGSPALLQAQLECIAFMLKNGKPFEPVRLLDVLDYFISQPQRFRLGRSVPSLAKLALANLPEDSPAWEMLDSKLHQKFLTGGFEAERVAELLEAAAPAVERVACIGRAIFLQALEPGSGCKASPTALDAVYAGVAISVEQFSPLALIDRLRSHFSTIAGQDAAAAFRLVFRTLVALPAHEQANMWTSAMPNGLATLSLDQLRLIATALGEALGSGAEAGQIPCVEADLAKRPTFAVLEALRRLGWLRAEILQAALVQCEQIVNDTVAAAWEESVLLPAARIQLVDAQRALSEFGQDRISAAGFATIAQALAAVSDAVAAGDGRSKPASDASSADAFSQELCDWVQHWLCAQVGAQVSDAAPYQPPEDAYWDTDGLASMVCAKLVVAFELAQRVLGGFDGVPERLLPVAIHVSEAMPDGELLGFPESPQLLWKLAFNSTDAPDWRDAILLPYIMEDRERVCKVLTEGLEAGELDLGHSAALLQAGLARPALRDEIIDVVLWPALTRPETPPETVQAIIHAACSILKGQGLLAKLAQLYADQVLSLLPENVRTAAQSLAAAVVTTSDSDGQSESLENLDAAAVDDPTSAEDDQVSPAPPPLPLLSKDEPVFYEKGDARHEAVIKGVHLDDPSAPYYTVAFPDGREVQTTAAHLKPKLVQPQTLQELNVLLAQARRNGDHKESLRLMKLQPSLLPKPVDTDEARRQALAAARNRRVRALEQLARAKKDLLGGDAGVASASAGATVAGSSPASPSSKGTGSAGAAGQHKRDLAQCTRALKTFASAVDPARPVALSGLELRGLVAVAGVLETFAPSTSIATHFRYYDPKDQSFGPLLLAVLAVLRALAAHFPVAELPDTLQTYMERTILACTVQNPPRPTFLQPAFQVVAESKAEEGFAQRPLAFLLDLVLDPSQRDLLSAEMTSQIARIPCAVVLAKDKEIKNAPGHGPSLLEGLLDATKLDGQGNLSSAVIDLVASCCKRSDELVKRWWSERAAILDRVRSGAGHGAPSAACSDMDAALLEQDAADDASEGESASESGEGEILTFAPAPWCILLSILRRVRNILPKERAVAAEEIEQLEVVNDALHWSLLSREVNLSPVKRQVALLSLRVLPVLSRRWFTDSRQVHHGVAALVRQRVGDYIGPEIIREELAEVDAASENDLFDRSLARADAELASEGAEASASSASAMPDYDCGTITVTTNLKSRSVTALYEKEDCAVEIQIEVPPAFPLEKVEVQCTKQVGIKKERWRRMVLQITTMLSMQDGTLLDAITFWKFNMDKDFQGMEPCPICYAVVHATDQSLPKLRCGTCKNSFHAKCLVKWFRTSHKNDCPLCKQPF